MKTNPVTEIEGMSPEEYAALWGCDASYDPPGRLGDGAMFYNFGNSEQKRTLSWLKRFMDAISFQAKRVLEKKTKDKEEARQNDLDYEGLRQLHQHVEFLKEDLEAKQKEYGVQPRFTVLREGNGDSFYIVDLDVESGHKDHEIVMIGHQIPLAKREQIAIMVCDFLTRNPF